MRPKQSLALFHKYPGRPFQSLGKNLHIELALSRITNKIYSWLLLQHNILGFLKKVFSVTIDFVSVSKELICFLAGYIQHMLFFFPKTH